MCNLQLQRHNVWTLSYWFLNWACNQSHLRILFQFDSLLNATVLIDIIERVLRRIKWNVNEAKSIEVIFLVFYLVIQKTVQTVEQRLNSSLLYQWRWVNPLHPNISMHILHTVCSTFPKVLTRRNCWTIKGFFSQWLFPVFSWP